MLPWQHICCRITKKYWLYNVASYSRVAGWNSLKKPVSDKFTVPSPSPHNNLPFKDEAQTALFKEPVRTAQ